MGVTQSTRIASSASAVSGAASQAPNATASVLPEPVVAWRSPDWPSPMRPPRFPLERKDRPPSASEPGFHRKRAITGPRGRRRHRRTNAAGHGSPSFFVRSHICFQDEPQRDARMGGKASPALLDGRSGPTNEESQTLGGLAARAARIGGSASSACTIASTRSPPPCKHSLHELEGQTRRTRWPPGLSPRQFARGADPSRARIDRDEGDGRIHFRGSSPLRRERVLVSPLRFAVSHKDEAVEMRLTMLAALVGLFGFAGPGLGAR